MRLGGFPDLTSHNFWNGFCQLNFYKNFQISLGVKIEINRDDLTLCQAHGVL